MLELENRALGAILHASLVNYARLPDVGSRDWLALFGKGRFPRLGTIDGTVRCDQNIISQYC